ncbi:transcription initiation factor IIA, gamma subunit, helical domain-containing protein [Gaertneriomyces semiglobifer]|nr:transcription initiation factor IIA, gamma subunit, helical domain-containing protein [Gaertneriomyces semiglobifer]
MAQELYRRSSLGTALTDTLDELITEGHIDPQTAMRVLAQFDCTISDVLHTKVKAKALVKGHLHVYRFCDDVWTMVVDKPTFKLEGGETIEADRVKMVACTSRAPPGAFIPPPAAAKALALDRRP